MRWSSKSKTPVPSTQYPILSFQRRVGFWVLITGYWVLLAAAPAADEAHISVYSPVAVYTLPVLNRGGREYVGLLELLEPLGRVSSQTDGRRWKLRYNSLEAEFDAGKSRARIHGRDFDLSAPFLIENARGLVPLNSLAALLPRFLGTPVNFRESARRLFVGVVGIQPSFRLDAGNPPRLLLNFSAPVNPTISTEPGKLRMIFKRDPVVSPGSQSISFDNQTITHASYSENNGDAELDVTATQPMMATFSSDRKTITISISSVPQTAQQTAQPSAVGTTPQNASQATPPPAAPRRVLAVVDPAHGGDERGAALTDKLAEKDVTLGFARLLRHELEIRGFAGQRRPRIHRAASSGRNKQRIISSLERRPGSGSARQPHGFGGYRDRNAKERISSASLVRVPPAIEQRPHASRSGRTGARTGRSSRPDLRQLSTTRRVGDS